jgi:hypothetical protein
MVVEVARIFEGDDVFGLHALFQNSFGNDAGAGAQLLPRQTGMRIDHACHASGSEVGCGDNCANALLVLLPPLEEPYFLVKSPADPLPETKDHDSSNYLIRMRCARFSVSLADLLRQRQVLLRHLCR